METKEKCRLGSKKNKVLMEQGVGIVLMASRKVFFLLFCYVAIYKQGDGTKNIFSI